ncbi:MAG: hypothetical protein V1696_00400 [Candidatus Jorgensenbacteria bacterium]
MSPIGPKLETLRARLRVRLGRIQRAPESSRKRWLTAASVTTMVVVVVLWVVYLNITLPSTAQSESPPPIPEKSAGDTFGKTLGRGFSAISDDIAREWERAKEETTQTFRSLRETVERENQFTLGGENAAATSSASSSMPPDLQTVPPVLLPQAPAKGEGQ